MNKKVLVAMSGGVDSSVAAFLLKKEGCDVVGVTLRLWHAEDDRARPGGCCSLKDIHDAKRVCDALAVPHYVFDLEEDFRKCVVDDFVSEYLHGRTPNPCIVCNEKIKFELLGKKAVSLGFEFTATGHYARLERTGAGVLLKKGKDAAKDQSYVLYRLNQEWLSRLLLPLGEYTKKEIREIARQANLPCAEKPESQEICFVDKDYAAFLRQYVPDADKHLRPGPIVTRDGTRIGTHKGYPLYTVGQRSGLGLTSPAPLYVINIDAAANTLVVGEKADVFSKSMTVEQVTWTAGLPPVLPAEYAIKIRRLHEPARGTIAAEGRDMVVEFAEPQPAVTPGQSAVFYDGDIVLGGGLIRSSAPAANLYNKPQN